MLRGNGSFDQEILKIVSNISTSKLCELRERAIVHLFFLSVIKFLVRVGVSIESCACYVCFCPLSNISRELFQLLCNATPSHTHASLLWPCPSHKLRWSSTSGGFQRGKMLKKKIL
jgi:hypothetical protein